MKKRGYLPKLAFCALCAVAAASGQARAGDRWDWAIEPYVWAASIGTDLKTVRPPTDAESELDFGDVIDKLDGVFQVRVEGRGDRIGAFADFTYLGLADRTTRRTLSTETDLDTRLLDFGASWRPGGRRDAGLDLLTGIRYVDVDLGVQFKPNDPNFVPRAIDSGRDYTDLLVGARYAWQFQGNWGMSLRGDLSFGDTEGSWSAAVMGQYRTGSGMWLFGYRYLEIELGDGDLDTTISMSGPQVGYGFRF